MDVAYNKKFFVLWPL